MIGYDGNMEHVKKKWKSCREVYTIFLWSIFGLLTKKHIFQKCILFFCDPFFGLLGKKHIFDAKKTFPRSVYYFFVIHFWTLGLKKHIFKVKKTFPRSVYYFFVVQFWTFETKSHSPEVYTIFLWSIFELLGKKTMSKITGTKMFRNLSRVCFGFVSDLFQIRFTLSLNSIQILLFAHINELSYNVR